MNIPPIPIPDTATGATRYAAQPAEIVGGDSDVDGDTVDLVKQAGIGPTSWHSDLVRIRLSHIDAPELRSSDPVKRQAARDARAFVELTIASAGPERPLSIWLHDRDKYGRDLAQVLVGDLDLSQEMLRLGLAVPYEGGKR